LHVTQAPWTLYRPPGKVYLETAVRKTALSADVSKSVDILLDVALRIEWRIEGKRRRKLESQVAARSSRVDGLWS
jgi:hypothetical protein